MPINRPDGRHWCDPASEIPDEHGQWICPDDSRMWQYDEETRIWSPAEGDED